MNRYLGVDLHRNCFTVCTLKEDGQSELRKWSIHSLSEFVHTVQATDAVAVEATGNTRYFCRSLKERGCRLVVVNPQQFQVISRSVKKTDAHDAKTLAQFLARDLLPEVRLKETLAAEIASVLQTRDKLVKLRTTLKNKINNLLAGQGILICRESLSSDKGLEQVLQAAVSDLERVELEVLVAQIRHLTASGSWRGPSRNRGRGCRVITISRASRGSAISGPPPCYPPSAISTILPVKGNWRAILALYPGWPTLTKRNAVAGSPSAAINWGCLRSIS